MSKLNHMSHGLGDHVTEHAHSDIARNGAAKRVTGIEVAHGQRSRSSGGATVTGSIKSVPGFGNSTVRSGDPTVHPAASKRTIVAPPVPGHRSRTSQHSADLGEAILATAFSRSDSADCTAHGRNPDGSRR